MSNTTSDNHNVSYCADILKAHSLSRSTEPTVTINKAHLAGAIRHAESLEKDLKEAQADIRTYRRALNPKLAVEPVISNEGRYADIREGNQLHISLGLFDSDVVPEISKILDKKISIGLKALNVECWPSNSGIDNKAQLLNYSIIKEEPGLYRINILISLHHRLNEGYRIVPKLNGETKSTFLSKVTHITYTDLLLALYVEEETNE